MDAGCGANHDWDQMDDKHFAFTVFDDTDDAQLPEIKYVYDFLHDLGILTTKSIWPLKGSEEMAIEGATCADPDYLAWALALQEQGFEIAFHNATYETSPRERTLAGLERFRELFGHDPYTFANHKSCREGLYWGCHRLSGSRQFIYNILRLFQQTKHFQGHVEGSPYYWGDACKDRIQYMRNFIFGEINTLKACPFMPYHDPQRPYVRQWFASSNGPDVESFCAMIAEEAQDRLEAERGTCIMYTHFSRRFYADGALNPRFKFLMERLSKKNGLFVPVKPLLDRLSNGTPHILTDRERTQLEWRWLQYKMQCGGTA